MWLMKKIIFNINKSLAWAIPAIGYLVIRYVGYIIQGKYLVNSPYFTEFKLK